MTRPAAARRSFTGLVGAVVGAGALLTAPAGPQLQAVVSYDGPSRDVAGVTVVGRLPHLQMAVVRGDAAALTRLTRAAGVRGVALDDEVVFTSRKSKDKGDKRAYLAAAGLDGAAGEDGAGAGVRVAVVDTGVSDTPALNRASGRLVDAADASHVGEVRTGGVYRDGFGHGTFMATVLAGDAVEGTDGAALGVAPGATVLNVRVAKQDGTTSLSRVLGGLDWITGHADQVDVANLALSKARPGDGYGSDPLTDAVEQVRDAGVTVVVAAGNDRDQVGDPGFDPRVLTVGSVDLGKDRVASFSGSDVVAGVRKPDVVANGVDVLGMLPLGSVIEQDETTRHLAHGLFRGSGTSQSTAVVSGLAAIFLAANPTATPTQVKASLRCAADDLRGKRDGAGAVATTTTVCAGSDGQALDGSGDATGEVGFDANAWAANAWAANAWGANAWAANAWGANAWGASAWAGADWGGEE